MSQREWVQFVKDCKIPIPITEINDVFRRVDRAEKEAKAKAKKAGKSTQKLAAAPPTSVADASIHNKGFYLASNKIKRGSNVIIYGTGATVNHQGGGVANSGGLGPKGGSGGGHSAAAGRQSPRAKSKA